MKQAGVTRNARNIRLSCLVRQNTNTDTYIFDIYSISLVWQIHSSVESNHISDMIVEEMVYFCSITVNWTVI